jgi:hypothetical protein
MRFFVNQNAECRLERVELTRSKHGFGVVKLLLVDMTTDDQASMTMAIMDWERIKKEVDRLLIETLPERVGEDLPPGEYALQCLNNTTEVTRKGLEVTTSGFVTHEGKRHKVNFKQVFKGYGKEDTPE